MWGRGWHRREAQSESGQFYGTGSRWDERTVWPERTKQATEQRIARG